MLTISLDTEIKARITERARTRGLSDEVFVRILIGDGLGNPLPPLTNAQVRQALGLDD